MPYELTFTPRAERDLERVPLSLLDVLEEHLRRLASAPTQGTRPSAFPFPPDCLIYQFQEQFFNGNTYLVSRGWLGKALLAANACSSPTRPEPITGGH
jgi:hypothetical protein